MLKKNYIILISSLVLAFVAVWFMNSYLSRERAAISRDAELIDAITAVGDLEAGTLINANLFSSTKVPRKFLHTNAIMTGDIDFNRMVGVRLAFPMKSGDVLSWKDLSTRDETKRASQIVKKGYRALSIPLSGVASVSNFIRPNDHIDLIGTFRIEFPRTRGSDEAPPAKYTTVTLLQNVVVLATGQKTEYSPPSNTPDSQQSVYSDVTVEVTEEEAQQIVFAQSKGSLTAILRNAEDVETKAKTPKTTIETVFKDEYRELLQNKRDRRIEIIRGGQ